MQDVPPRTFDMSVPIPQLPSDFQAHDWARLLAAFPPGSPVSGTVIRQDPFGVWVRLDELPSIPALLEIIHFAIRESDPLYRIQFPIDYPSVDSQLSARILAWSLKPNDVRLTQLSDLDWIRQTNPLPDGRGTIPL